MTWRGPRRGPPAGVRARETRIHLDSCTAVGPMIYLIYKIRLDFHKYKPEAQVALRY